MSLIAAGEAAVELMPLLEEGVSAAGEGLQTLSEAVQIGYETYEGVQSRLQMGAEQALQYGAERVGAGEEMQQARSLYHAVTESPMYQLWSVIKKVRGENESGFAEATQKPGKFEGDSLLPNTERAMTEYAEEAKSKFRQSQSKDHIAQEIPGDHTDNTPYHPPSNADETRRRLYMKAPSKKRRVTFEGDHHALPPHHSLKGYIGERTSTTGIPQVNSTPVQAHPILDH